MKKILAIALALCMVLSLGAAAFADDDITLDVIICQYGPNTQEWFLGKGMNGTNFVDKFEAENPGIKLNLEVVSWNDVYTVVDTRIAAGQAPDILNIDVFANYANEGLLEPVSQWCPEELYNDFFPSFIDQSVIDDTVWAVPDLASARALFYNVDMFEEVGIEVPTTWAELEDASQAIIDFYDGEVYPWGIDMTTDEGQAAFAYYTWGNGGGFVDADGNWAVNSPETSPPTSSPPMLLTRAAASTSQRQISLQMKARALPPSVLWTVSWPSKMSPLPTRQSVTKPSASSLNSSTILRTT